MIISSSHVILSSSHVILFPSNIGEVIHACNLDPRNQVVYKISHVIEVMHFSALNLESSDI